MLKSLEAAKDRRIESANAAKQQKIDAICDVMVQRIQTGKDTVEVNKDGNFDLDTNQIIERKQQQQRDIEILVYSDKYDKDHKVAWAAYLKYAKLVDANTTRRTNAQIATLERRVKAVQTAAE